MKQFYLALGILLALIGVTVELFPLVLMYKYSPWWGFLFLFNWMATLIFVLLSKLAFDSYWLVANNHRFSTDVETK